MTNRNDYAIVVENLTKCYGDLQAVHDVSFTVRKGAVFAFLGPNGAGKTTTVEIIETHLDDWNSEGFPYLCDLLLKQGALDVSLTPMLMKKGRPGQQLRVICYPSHGQQLKQTILSETTAIGLRFRTEARLTLEREQVMVETPWGKVMAKKVQTPAGPVIYPEYEACRKIAESAQIPLQQVYRAVLQGTEEKE